MIIFRKEQYKLLYKEAENEKRNQKVDKIKEKFEKFENGEIKADEFKEFIKNVIIFFYKKTVGRRDLNKS
jgi:hypothetical protein